MGLKRGDKPFEERIKARLKKKRARDLERKHRLMREAREIADPHRVVYFIQPGEEPFVKIGITDDLVHRVESLQTASPHALRVLGQIPGTMRTEREIHVLFSHLRVRGEWFRLTSEVIDYVQLRVVAVCTKK